jgi:hypothetical protein
VELSRSDAHGNQWPDDKDNSRDLSAWFRGSACPEGDPTDSIKSPWSLFLLPTPPKSHFLAFCQLFLECFWLYIIPPCLFVH